MGSSYFFPVRLSTMLSVSAIGVLIRIGRSIVSMCWRWPGGAPPNALSTPLSDAPDDRAGELGEVAVMHADGVGMRSGVEHQLRLADQAAIHEDTQASADRKRRDRTN